MAGIEERNLRRLWTDATDDSRVGEVRAACTSVRRVVVELKLAVVVTSVVSE